MRIPGFKVHHVYRFQASSFQMKKLFFGIRHLDLQRTKVEQLNWLCIILTYPKTEGVDLVADVPVLNLGPRFEELASRAEAELETNHKTFNYWQFLVTFSGFGCHFRPSLSLS